ncbi:MAG: hypothetical protein AAGD06_32230 [Acidobacteriota bacterium]
MKSVRRMFCVLVMVVGLALVATPTWADDDHAVASAWEELVQWVIDVLTPEAANDGEPLEPEDEALPHPDPSG